MTLKQIWIAWNEFWFAPQSPSPICVYRILYGLLLATYGILFIPEAVVWFGQHGIISAQAVQAWQNGPRLSLLLWLNPDDRTMLCLLGAMITASLCVAAGIWTRGSTVIAWVLFESFYHRNPLIGNIGDAFLRLAGFILIFAPCGAMYSVDSLVRRLAGQKQPAFYLPWAQRLLQFQLALVYFQGFTTKIDGARWWDGTAAYFATHLRGFAHFGIPPLLDHLWLYQLISWSTMLTELSLFTLIWVKEFRYWVLFAGILMHVGIDLIMSLPMLVCVFISAYINFVEPALIERCISRLCSLCRLSRGAAAPEESTAELRTEPQALRRKGIISAFVCWFLFSAVLSALPSHIVLRRHLLRPFTGTLSALGLNQTFGVFAPALPERGLDLKAVVEFTDGSSVVWNYPDLENRRGFDRLVNDRYRKLLYGRLLDNNLFWPSLARYAARECDRNSRHPVKVSLIKRMLPLSAGDIGNRSLALPYEETFFVYSLASGDLGSAKH